MFDLRKKFQNVFKKYHTKTYSFTQKYVKDSSDIEDIVQNIFLHLWNNFSKVHKKSNSEIEGVVFKTAKQEISNFYRKKKIDTTAIDENDFADSGDFDKSTQYDFSLKIEKITQLLKNIPERRLNFFYLNKLNDQSYSKIAKEHNISKSAVEKQISKTVAYLKVKLDIL